MNLNLETEIKGVGGVVVCEGEDVRSEIERNSNEGKRGPDDESEGRCGPDNEEEGVCDVFEISGVLNGG